MNEFNISPEERLTQEVVREQAAESVLNNAEFKRFFLEYRGQLFDSLSHTKWNEIDKREEIYRQLKSLNTMEAKLTEAINTGKMARDELNRMQKAAKAVKNVIGL